NLGAGHHGKTADFAGGRGRPAGALGHVLIDFAVFVRSRAEALHRRIDHPRIDLLDRFPGKAHAIDRAGREVFHHHIAYFNQPGEDLLAPLSLRIERQAALVRVEHREVETVHAWDVPQLTPRGITLS